ncbi:conserved hypothetical protein [Desulfamplus magnetovallimortis]|uniref:Ribosome-associated protein n=1 Tax=Desulfamplus magnetovallimortis TaxID=1246637 RepID=A0A1W1HHH6_9BACT|nr:conserved hypothetical protein [Desulfamplus magnetovallimortis]
MSNGIRHTTFEPEFRRFKQNKKKRLAENLQKLGESLVELPETEIHKMEISEILKKAALDAQAMTKHGAKRRQMQYIGTLMRNLDPEIIERAVEEISRGRRVAEMKFKEMETWREILIKDGDEYSNSDLNFISNQNIFKELASVSVSSNTINSNTAMESFIEKYPETDRQRLGQLVRNARKDLLQHNHHKNIKDHKLGSTDNQCKTPKTSRVLFRYIREMIELHEQTDSPQ